ncbi:TBC1 domain family member 22B [Bagarius yarrelli]|uniref:TBC1 domain family member 22B n=1 Tax=Bagarius yarrelli TaxID=175774 RepID=A0A556TH51_BAGYA|nr:TBC1 domain family member 22B [Bagarius yarrelli]
MAAQNLNIEVVMETANKVIENHSKQRERRQQQQLDEPPEPEEKDEEEGHDKDEEEQLEEEETTTELSFSSERLHHSDSRLVKSHSEAPIGSPKEMSGERAALYRQQSLPHRPVIPLVARMADQNTSGTPAMTEREASRLDKFRQLLAGPNTDLGSYTQRCHQVSSVCCAWMMTQAGYLPANAERRASTLQRKRQEYFGFIEQYYDSRNDEHHQDTYRQIHIDIPRTNPLIPLFQQASVQEIFERILFIWAIRHPASGYVQGINDLVTPFFVVYIFEYIAHISHSEETSASPLIIIGNLKACFPPITGVQRGKPAQTLSPDAEAPSPDAEAPSPDAEAPSPDAEAPSPDAEATVTRCRGFYHI